MAKQVFKGKPKCRQRLNLQPSNLCSTNGFAPLTGQITVLLDQLLIVSRKVIAQAWARLLKHSFIMKNLAHCKEGFKSHHKNAIH